MTTRTETPGQRAYRGFYELAPLPWQQTWEQLDDATRTKWEGVPKGIDEYRKVIRVARELVKP